MDCGIETVLAPTTLDEFAGTYWGRRPLFVHGTAGKFATLFDTVRFHRAIADGRPRVAALRAARPDEPLTAGYTEEITPDDVERELSSGATVCVTGIEMGDPALMAFVESARSRLGLAGEVRFNCFLSPPGSGAELHIDARVTMSLQIEGAKRWWYGTAPAVDWPLSNAQLRSDGSPMWMYPWQGAASWERLAPVREEQLEQRVLHPGDLLCLPAGTWHRARAVERSLALNLSFSPPDLFGLVRRLVERRFLDEPHWRGGVPPHPASDTVPRDFLAERLSDLAAFLGDVDGRAEDAVRIWREMCGRPPGGVDNDDGEASRAVSVRGGCREP